MSQAEPIIVEVPASELPESILARFRERPAGTTRFTVTVAPAMSREEKLEALRRDIDRGLDDLDGGRVVDGETVFSELKTRFPAA